MAVSENTLIEQYTRQLEALLPPGDALRVESGSDLQEVVRRLSIPFAKKQAWLDGFIDECNPARSVALISDWEYALGLPDACTFGTQDLLSRQRAAYAKYTDVGGARIARYIGIANALGYPNARTQRYAMHTCEMTCETPLYEMADRFRWSMVLNAATDARESTVNDDCETPLQIWGDGVIECVISREAPAISEVNFMYNG